MIYALSDGLMFILACSAIFTAITGMHEVALLVCSIGIATCIGLLISPQFKTE